MRLGIKVKGMIGLFRPELPFAAGVCVLLGEVIALGGLPSIPQALPGFMVGFFISASALILNDYFDLEVDRVNAPERPLPSGVVSPTEAIALTVLTTLIGLSAALAISPAAFAFSVVFWAVGALYNWRYKQAGLAGNLMVAACVGCTFVLGGMVVRQPWDRAVWFFALIAFLIDLSEEILGDSMDIEGDKKRGSRSIAILWGRQAALRIAAGLLLLVVVLSFIPYLLGLVGTLYLVIMGFTGSVTLISIVRLVRSRTSEEGRRYMRWIYLGALAGMLVFIIGQAVT